MPKLLRRHTMQAEKLSCSSESKIDFWRQHIEDCSRSHLSQYEYCRTHDLALSTFSYWKRRLIAGKKERVCFYPLAVEVASQPVSPSAGSGLSLYLGQDKYHVELSANFSTSALKQLIVTLDQL